MRHFYRMGLRSLGTALLLWVSTGCSEDPRFAEAPESSVTKLNTGAGYANAERETFSYDAEGRLVLRVASQWVDGTWRDDASFAWVYDGDGLLVSRTSSKTRVTYEYESGLLMLESSWKRDDQSADWVAERRRSFTYDGESQLLGIAESRLVSGAFVDDCRQRFSYSGGRLPVGIDRYCPGEDGTLGAIPVERTEFAYDGVKLTAMVESDASGAARRTALAYDGDQLTRVEIETKGGGDAAWTPSMTLALSRSGSTLLSTISQWTGAAFAEVAQVETKLSSAGTSHFLSGAWAPEPVHRDWREWLYYGASPTWR